MDLREQLDQAIGHGPPLPPPEQRLAAAQRAVRRWRARVALGAAAAVVAVVLAPIAALGGWPASEPDRVGTAVAPDLSAGSSHPADDPPTGGTGDPGLAVVIVDGVPELAGHPAGITIGPVVRNGERAFGLEVRLKGERSFVVLLRRHDGWQVHRLVTAERGEDLASWLRAQGWLPTGEAS